MALEPYTRGPIVPWEVPYGVTEIPAHITNAADVLTLVTAVFGTSAEVYERGPDDYRIVVGVAVERWLSALVWPGSWVGLIPADDGDPYRAHLAVTSAMEELLDLVDGRYVANLQTNE